MKRNIFLLIRQWVSLIPGLLLSFGVVAQPAIQGSTTFQLNGKVSKDKLSIPLKLAGSFNLPFDKPVMVRAADNRMSDVFRNAISLKMDTDRSRIELEIDLTVLNAPGTYEVTFVCTSGPNNDKTSLVVSLVRPAAVLDAPAVLNITIEGDSVVTADPLLLHEKGNTAGIPLLGFVSPHPIGVKEGVLLYLGPTPLGIPANGFLSPKYRIKDQVLSDLPLGPSSGQLYISAPELQASVPVKVQITKTRNKGWIFVALLGGLLLGGLVRHFLQDKRDWEGARLKGIAVVQQMRAESGGVRDADYQRSINELLKGLMAALSGRGGIAGIGISATDLTTLINSTQTEYKTKRDALLQAVSNENGVWASLAGIFLDTNLQDDLKTVLSGPIVALNKARGYLDDKDLTSAKQVIDNGKKLADLELAQLQVYYKAYSGLQTVIMLIEMPAELTQAVTAYLKAITDAADAMLAAGSNQELVVKNADNLFEYKQKLFNYLIGQLDLVYRIDPAAPPAAVEAFKKELETYTTILGKMSANPIGLIDPRQYWDAGLPARLTAAWTAVKPATGAGPNNAPAFRATTLNLQPPVKEKLVDPNPFTTQPPIDLPTLASRSLGWYLLYSVLRAGALAVLMSLAAYNLYAPKFVGTWSELIAILLVAFSLDVTVENVALLRDRRN